jgi:hypothetical protein
MTSNGQSNNKNKKIAIYAGRRAQGLERIEL